MKQAIKLGLNVHCITGIGFDANIYLIVCERPVLIDTGTGAHNSRTLKFLLKSTAKIEKIILTHRHYDHIGGAYELCQKFKCELYAHELDAQSIMNADPHSTGMYAFGGSLKKMSVKPLSDNTLIDCGDVKLKVLHTPGHTIGSIVLYEECTKTLFSGDTVFTNGSVGRWDLETGSYEMLLQSVERLCRLNVNALYPGHGPYADKNGSYHLQLGLEYLRCF